MTGPAAAAGGSRLRTVIRHQGRQVSLPNPCGRKLA